MSRYRLMIYSDCMMPAAVAVISSLWHYDTDDGLPGFPTLSWTRSQAVAMIADRTPSQHLPICHFLLLFLWNGV